jgi:hypothetical protein
VSQAGILNAVTTPLPPEIATEYICNTGIAVPAANILNVFGATGTTTEGSGNTITITSVSSGFTWNLVTNVSPVNPIQIVTQNGYSCQGVSQVTFILPLAPTFGDTFIVASTTSTFQITQNGSQKIIFGSASTTAGSGTLNSNTVGDTVEIVYMGSNTFQVISPQGTITLT